MLCCQFVNSKNVNFNLKYDFIFYLKNFEEIEKIYWNSIFKSNMLVLNFFMVCKE